MTNVAAEFERAGLKIPIFVSGATTSLRHTAIKIAPNYSGLVVHAKDASHAVTICSRLMDKKNIDKYSKEINDEHQRMREMTSNIKKSSEISQLSIEDARTSKPSVSWSASNITTPSFIGTRTFKAHGLNELVDYIDWTFFFIGWQMKHKYPEILDHPEAGEEARELFADAKKDLEDIIKNNTLTADGVIGFFPANSVNENIEIYADEKRDKIITTLEFPRQLKSTCKPPVYNSLADFIAPKNSGIKDYIGCFALTTGIGSEDIMDELRTEGNEYKAIMLKFLSFRLVEAFAEAMHEKIRKELWGYAKDENLTIKELLECKYIGIRPAPGYACCPDHNLNPKIFKLLDAEKQTGIKLTESNMMYPESSVCGFYFSHPNSKYFPV